MTKLFETPVKIWLTGATSGIGHALARALLDEGHHLILTGRRQEALDAMAREAGEQVTTARADTTSKEDLAAVREQLDREKTVQVAILNAGTCEYLDVANYSSDIIEKNIHTNVIGTARSVEAVLPSLRSARRQGLPARLVIVSSSAWWFPFGRAEGYGASKAALTYFAQSLRADLAPEGIGVTVVSPGFVKTPLTDRNDFPMPFLISADEAARQIVKGLKKGKSEIQFPKRFTWMLRGFAALPQGLIDRMAAAMVRSQNKQEQNQ